MALEGIHRMIDSVESKSANFPLTLIYNEGWLLRLVMDWYSKHTLKESPLIFQDRASWFSEALLPSPFRPRHRVDSRAEGRTHADGIVGQISVGRNAKADVRLLDDTTQLIVIEAKIYSHLSGGTQNAPTYDQAARNVACIAELLSRANRIPSRMTSLAFLVVAPETQIKKGLFTQQLEKEVVKTKVETRAEAFSSDLGGWVKEWFIPTLDIIRIEALSWESLIGSVVSNDPEAFHLLWEFYEGCLKYNGLGPRIHSMPT